jgi:hypothetical protein
VELLLKRTANQVLMVICFMCFLSACNGLKTEIAKQDCGPWNFGIAQASSNDKPFLSDPKVHNAKTECLQTVYAKAFDEYDPPIDAKFAYRSEESSAKRRAVRAGEARERVEKSEILSREVFQMTLRSAQHNFEFETHSKWETSVSPSPLYQVFAKNREGRAALFISVYDANPFLIWSDSRDSMYLRMRDELAYSDITRIKETKFQNFEGFQVEYRGRDKHAVPLHFLSTQIRLGKKILYLTTWSFEEDFAQNEQEFHLIANSLRMQSRF